jgi:hypothetical protein
VCTLAVEMPIVTMLCCVFLGGFEIHLQKSEFLWLALDMYDTDVIVDSMYVLGLTATATVPALSRYRAIY